MPLSLCAVFARVTHGGLRILDLIAGGILGVVVAVRAPRIGVWADAEQVVVRNLWKTYGFKWADVSRVEVRGLRQNNRGAKYWVFRMRDGKGVAASGLLPLSETSDATRILRLTPRAPVDLDWDT